MAICAWFCAAVGGPGGPLGLLPGDGRSPRVTCACCENVFALEVLYPSFAMQADQLAIAFLIEPSATSALSKFSRMLKHLPAAACAPAGRPANGAPGWPGAPAAPPLPGASGVPARKP